MKIPINKIQRQEERIIEFLKRNKGYAMNTEYIYDKIKESRAKTYYWLKKLARESKIKENKVGKSFVYYIE